MRRPSPGASISLARPAEETLSGRCAGSEDAPTPSTIYDRMVYLRLVGRTLSFSVCLSRDGGSLLSSAAGSRAAISTLGVRRGAGNGTLSKLTHKSKKCYKTIFVPPQRSSHTPCGGTTILRRLAIVKIGSRTIVKPTFITT